MKGFVLALVPALLFGVFGFAVYGFFGVVVFLVAKQWLPHLIGGVIAWIGLCAVLEIERHVRRSRIGRALEALINRQLMTIFA